MMRVREDIDWKYLQQYRKCFGQDYLPLDRVECQYPWWNYPKGNNDVPQVEYRATRAGNIFSLHDFMWQKEADMLKVKHRAWIRGYGLCRDHARRLWLEFCRCGVFSDVPLLNRRRLSTNRLRKKDGLKKVDDIEWSLRNPRLFVKKGEIPK